MVDIGPTEPSTTRRLLGNLGHLLRGRGIAAIMLLATTALMARALGPAEFGLVILIHTYAILVRGLLNVKQFLGLIQHGVPALDAGDLPLLRRLTAVCWKIDRITCIAATAIAACVAPLVGPYLGMDEQNVIILTIYSLVLLSTGNRTSLGILRLYDRFDVLGNKEIVGPAIRLTGVTIGWWLNSSMEVFVIVFAVSYVAEELYLNWSGWREYRLRVGPPAESESPRDAKLAEFPGLKGFLWITYWQSNVDLIPKHGSILLAGLLLGPTEAGLLRLARQFSTLLSKPAGLIRQVVFPDLTRSWNHGSADFKLIIYRTAMLAGSVGAVFVIVGHLYGETLLDVFVGKEFVAAAPLLTLLLLASTFDLASASLRPAAYAIGHAYRVLRLYAFSAVVYLVSFFILTEEMGLIGSGIAACIATALPSLAMVVLILRQTPGRADRDLRPPGRDD